MMLAPSCGDNYLEVDHKIIDADVKIPIYFYATAEQATENTWRPVYTYYIYSIEEGEYDAYFHAYVVDGKKIWGQYVTDIEFSPYMIPDVTPMAYVSVEY